MNEAVLELPFDQYQRYRLVADLLRQLRAGGPRLRVLDVGGRTAVLREFLDDARIDLVDVEPSERAGLVLGDGSRLPFRDASFDAVCAFDTLEHVPPPLRRAFVAECRRVSRRWVVLAGPYADARVEEAEALLQRFLEHKLGERHRYLDEHLHNGLPVRAEVERQLSESGASVLAIPHGNLDRWLVLQCLSMYMDYDPALRPLARDFQRFYNSTLYASDHAAPVYRHVVVAALGGAALPQLKGLLEASSAPAGALRAGFELAAELVHFDRERARWRAERGGFQEVVAALEADLAGHRAALAEERAESARRNEALELERAARASDIAGLSAALGSIESDLRGHRAALEQATRTIDSLHELQGHSEAEYQEVVELLSTEQGNAARMRANLEADLEGHRKALSDVRAELEARTRASAHLEADLEGHRAALATARADLEGHQRSLEALRGDLDGHRRAVAELRADLDGHRRALSLARTDLEGRKAELQQAREELAEERRRRAEVEAALARSDSELRQTLSLASGLEQSLAQRELVYDALRSELRSRWRNLLRVFRPAR